MRKLLILSLFFLVMLPAVAQAQTVLYCANLSDADCALMNDSAWVMADLDSAAFTVSLTVIGENLPDGDFELLGVGNGAYHIGGIADDAFDGLARLDAAGQARQIADAISDLSADLDLALTVSSGDDVESLTLQMRLVDSIAYMNLATLRDLLGSPMLRGWGGIEVEGFIHLMIDEEPTVFEELAAASDAPAQPVYAEDLFPTTRISSGDSDIALFETRLNMGDLLEDEAFIEAFRAQMEESPDIENIDMMLMFMQMILGDSDIIIQQSIGVEDRYLYALEVSYDLELTRLVEGLLFGEQTRRGSDPMRFTFEYRVEYDRFNDAPAILAPKDPLGILDYDDMRQLMRGNVQF